MCFCSSLLQRLFPFSTSTLRFTIPSRHPIVWSHVRSARACRSYGAVGCGGMERPRVGLWRVSCEGPPALASFDLLTYFLFPCDTSQLLCGATSVAEYLTPEYPLIGRLNNSSFRRTPPP